MAANTQAQNSMLSLLGSYTTDSVLKVVSRKRNECILKQVYGDTDLTFEFLVSKAGSAALPHTVCVGYDNILCSCSGYLSALDCKALCSHIILCFEDLLKRKLVSPEDAKEMCEAWRIREYDSSKSN